MNILSSIVAKNENQLLQVIAKFHPRRDNCHRSTTIPVFPPNLLFAASDCLLRRKKYFGHKFFPFLFTLE
ncbi:MAG: hypothetical protein JWQ27_52 [Ferruginibacter sp.]|nr:hypothetical protein [Ferruginibacter sp.]